MQVNIYHGIQLIYTLRIGIDTTNIHVPDDIKGSCPAVGDGLQGRRQHFALACKTGLQETALSHRMLFELTGMSTGYLLHV